MKEIDLGSGLFFGENNVIPEQFDLEEFNTGPVAYGGSGRGRKYWPPLEKLGRSRPLRPGEIDELLVELRTSDNIKEGRLPDSRDGDIQARNRQVRECFRFIGETGMVTEYDERTLDKWRRDCCNFFGEDFCDFEPPGFEPKT